MNRVVNLILLFICMYLLIRLSKTRRMFALKGSFRFDLIIPIDSLTVIPFSCSEKKSTKNNWQQRLRTK